MMVKNILIAGAGRSSISLIKYLVKLSKNENYSIRIGDRTLDGVLNEYDSHPNVNSFVFDVLDDLQRVEEISKSTIVISMLPAHLHIVVAKDCVRLKKHMVTASYVSESISELDSEAKENGVLLLNEIGLDPGIDHMSAMKIINELRAKGANLKSFKSYCGGLIAPDSDNNPWGYKITWNPRNVVLAGQGTAKYIEGGEQKIISYEQLFRETCLVDVLNYGSFEAYANRDSLIYKDIYQLKDISTLYRGTLRRPGFSEAWNLFVQLGLTDDSYRLDVSNMTYLSFFKFFLKSSQADIKSYLKSHFGVSNEVLEKLEWLGVYEDVEIGLTKATPAEVLQQLLERKWALEESDKDMIVMQHQFIYECDGKEQELHSSLVVLGENQAETAMAKTVGLPIGIAVKLILNGDIKDVGVRIPVYPEIYLPVLSELENFGVKFIEESATRSPSKSP